MGGVDETFWIRLDTAAEAISLKSASVVAILTSTAEEDEVGASGNFPVDVSLVGAANEDAGGATL